MSGSQMRTLSIIAFLSFGLLSSCKTVEVMNAAAGIGTIETTNSSFDGSKEINLTPTMVTLTGDSFEVPTMYIGAHYKPSFGDHVTLILKFDGTAVGMSPLQVLAGKPSDYPRSNPFYNITALKVNIDGRILTFSPLGSTDFRSSFSKAQFSVPITTVKEMINAHDCRIQMTTLDNAEATCLFHIETTKGGKTFAKHYFRKYLETIESTMHGS
jgi:hypothetical protein